MFWIREVVGWVMLVTGLVIFGVIYFVLLSRNHYFASGTMTMIGIFLFRGGLHFLKVATAARICQQMEVRRPRTATAKR